MNGGSRKTSYLNHFASADTIVPDPTNPQAYNRYSYVYNNPIGYVDPDGHDPHWCEDATCVANHYGDNRGSYGGSRRLPPPVVTVAQEPKPTSTPSPIAPPATPTTMPTSTPTTTPSPTPAPTTTSTGLVLETLPLIPTSWKNGFGANWLAASDNGQTYANSSGLHPGIDISGPAGTEIKAVAAGMVTATYPGAADPNVEITTSSGMITLYGYVDKQVYPGDEVHVGDVIGTLTDKGDNSHLHFVVRQGGTTYNPLNFFSGNAKNILHDSSYGFWLGYAEGEGLYSISSYTYDASKNYWTDGEASVNVTRP